jgi:hypothetical protein
MGRAASSFGMTFLFSEGRKFKTVGKWTKFYYDDAALYRETQRPMLIPIKIGEL